MVDGSDDVFHLLGVHAIRGSVDGFKFKGQNMERITGNIIKGVPSFME